MAMFYLQISLMIYGIAKLFSLASFNVNAAFLGFIYEFLNFIFYGCVAFTVEGVVRTTTHKFILIHSFRIIHSSHHDFSIQFQTSTAYSPLGSLSAKHTLRASAAGFIDEYFPKIGCVRASHLQA
jgi:hypothetical protein